MCCCQVGVAAHTAGRTPVLEGGRQLGLRRSYMREQHGPTSGDRAAGKWERPPAWPGMSWCLVAPTCQ